MNGPSNPVAKGSYVSVYFTGGGQTNPPGVTGSVNSLTLKYLVQPVSATVGEQAAQVMFAGAAPQYVDGLEQLNLSLSGNTPSGAQPIVISVGGITSPQGTTIFVQ